MFVVEVMPIARGAFTDQLSFFCKERIEPGMVVDVTVRNKKTAGLVLSVKDAREEKTQLKRGGFALKKLEPKAARRIFLASTVRALTRTAMYHGVPNGTAFAHFAPSALLKAEQGVAEARDEGELPDLAADAVVLQAEHEERMSTYRNTTREAFAKGESVIILAPTAPEAEQLHAELSRGIEEQTVLLTSALTKKGTLTAWNRVATDPEPLLIIMTASFLSIPRENVAAIIIERESARSFTAHEHPCFDARIAAEALASERGCRIMYADFPVRVETHARLRAHDLEECGRLQRARRSGAPVRIVDSRSKEEDASKKKKFSPLSPAVTTLIETETMRGGRLFLYAARRGIAPLTICNDCGTPVTDPATGTPMTLHKTDAGNVFLSFRSGAILPAHTPCRHCGGWNLVSLGIGALRVHEEVETRFPDVPLFLFTAETANTHAKAKKLMKQFYGTPGAVLVGTDRALPYLGEPVEYAVVASIDSTLSSSAWRAHMHALHTMFYLGSRTTESLYIQTRLPDEPVIRALGSGNPSDCIDQELAERKMYGYPPYATFIGLSWTGTERAVQKHVATVQDALSAWELVGPLPPRAVSKNRYMCRAVVRLDAHVWPDEALVRALKTLPPDITVTVDPDDIV